MLDDYPYWVAKKYGYFGDIQTTLEPGPSDATASVKLVDQKQADMGYPSPGVFSLGLEQGIPDRLRLSYGRLRRVRLRLPEGREAKGPQRPRRQDVLLGSAGWQSICDPMLFAAGVDIKKIKYVEAGLAHLGDGAEGRQGRLGA